MILSIFDYTYNWTKLTSSMHQQANVSTASVSNRMNVG